MRLRVQPSPAWTAAVLQDFDSFLQDHAHCERKASGSAMNMLSHYPDRTALVAAMVDLAREELQHFSEVYRHMAARGLILGPDRKDPMSPASRRSTGRARMPTSWTVFSSPESSNPAAANVSASSPRPCR